MTNDVRGPLNSAEIPEAQPVGGVFNATPPAPLDGQGCALQVDSQGRLLVSSTGGGGGGNVNITGINSVPPALTNPLPVELSDGTNAFGTAGNPLSVNVITGGGSNASVGLTGAAAPTSATEIGIVVGGNLQNVSSATPLPVTGTKTNNNAAPGATNIGTLPGIANAAPPVWTEGDQVALSEDLSGNLRVKDVTLDALIVTEGSPAVPALRTTGNLTNNANPPSSNNFGVLSAVANAANPSWVEGDQVLVSVDLSGHQRVVATGAAASGAAVAGNPLLIAGKGSGNVDTLLTDGSGGLAAGGISVNGADGRANGIVSPISGSGSTIINQIYGYFYNGTTWDRARSAGVGNAVAATGLAAGVAYVQYNTTLPAPTAAQYTAAQCDTTGSTYVNIEGRKATYSAFASFTAVAGDIAVLPGSASKTIRVLRVEVSFVTSGTAAIETVQLVKRSAADTGGTSAAMTAVPHDSGFAGASAAPLSYTVAPTPGAAVGTIRGVQFNDASSTLPGANSWIWDFGSRAGASAIVLRGVAQQLAISLPTAVATQTAQVSYEWSEE